MTWQCRNVLVSTQLLICEILIHRNPWLVQLSTALNTSINWRCTELTRKLKKCARFYFGNDIIASKSNEVESIYLREKVTSLQVESSV